MDDDGIQWIYIIAGSCANGNELGWWAGVRRGDCVEDLASACVVEVDLMGLLEGGELGAGFGEGEGWFGHGLCGGEV